MTDAASSVPRRDFRLLQAIAAFFLAIKLVYVFTVGPIWDEAYYWMWGQRPGLSYFDHPPFHAWLLGLSDLLFGRGLFGLRWMTLATLAGILVIFRIWAKRLAGEDWRSLFWPGTVIYLASPTFGYFMSLAFHDYLLLFLVLTSAHFFLNYLWAADEGRRPRRLDLYVGAVLLGCAGLTKYNAVFLGLGIFFYILWRPSLRKLLADPHLYLAALIAIGMQAPVLIWNLNAQFASFGFHLLGRHGEGWLRDFRWDTFIDFPFASAFLVSPFLVPVFFRFFLATTGNRFESVAKGLAIWTFWLSSLTFVFVAAFDWVFWWWNLIAYIVAMPFAAKYMGQRWLFYGHVVFGALVALYLIVSAAIFPLSLLQGQPDWRQTRLYGWEELRDAVAAARDTYQPDFIASETSELASVLGFALDDPDVTALTERTTQFKWWWEPEAHRGENALLVLHMGYSPAYLATQFETLEEVGQVEVKRFGQVVNGFVIYRGRNYQPPDTPGQPGS